MPGARVIARHPDLVPVVAAAAAWLTLLVAPRAHAGHPLAPSGTTVAAMAVAMMGLLCVPGVRTVAFTSPWSRAHRSVAVFFAVFAGAWVVVASVMAIVMAAVTHLVPGNLCAAALLVASAAVQFSARRRRWVAGCDRPLRIHPYGPAADLDCARFGALTAARCIRLCALPMLAMLAVPSDHALMAAITGLVLAERVSEGRLTRPVAAGYAILGLALAAG